MPFLTFLIADDNHDDLLLLKEALHSVNPSIEILRASDGKGAVDACAPPASQNFDLVVLDYYLPVRTGKEILLQLCSFQLSPPLRVVVLSSHLSAEEKASLLESGAAVVLEKPSDYDGYLSLARQLIGLVAG